MLIMMILYGTSRRTIFYFIVINTLIKVVPLYYLRNESLKMNDIYCDCKKGFIGTYCQTPIESAKDVINEYSTFNL
jgi:hypothetical protein